MKAYSLCPGVAMKPVQFQSAPETEGAEAGAADPQGDAGPRMDRTYGEH
jgi:hypothetical protein